MSEFWDNIDSTTGALSWFFSFPTIGVGAAAGFLTLIIIAAMRNRRRTDKQGNPIPKPKLTLLGAVIYFLIIAAVSWMVGSWYAANKAAQLARAKALQEAAAEREREIRLDQKLYNVKFPGKIVIEAQDSVDLMILGELPVRAPKITNRKVTFVPDPAMVSHARMIRDSTGNENPRAFCEIGLRGQSKIIWDWVYYNDIDFVQMEAPANYRQALDKGELDMGVAMMVSLSGLIKTKPPAFAGGRRLKNHTG